MSILLKRPTISDVRQQLGRYERFNLKENPFPLAPIVNKESSDDRINGKIFEMEIRKKEYEIFENNFLKLPQEDPNHIRLGFIIDTSYIGRGNGKSAFLINLYNKINSDYCLEVSGGKNKCFSVYLTPEPGGRTKTYDKFVEVFFNGILETNIIKTSLAILRLESLLALYGDKVTGLLDLGDDVDLIESLNSPQWFRENDIPISDLNAHMFSNEHFTRISADFPLFKGARTLMPRLVTQDDFANYFTVLRRDEDILRFIFDELVNFFLAAGFNGAYVFVDDFERIPDFQSARQKKDFALELRTCLFDGLTENAKVGFFNFILVLHAGVPRLISEAWGESGMENRAPISSPISSKHVIPFEKLTFENAKLLVMRYLAAFRIDPNEKSLKPFTEDAVNKIAEISEYNASKILQKSYMLLEKAANEGIDTIDTAYLSACIDSDIYEEKPAETIASKETVNLLKKATDPEK